MEGANIDTLSAEEVIRLLDLAPLPGEGGFYRETFRSTTNLPEGALPDAYRGDRQTLTAIYFLVTAASPSAWHILPSDEVFLWHAGAAVQMLRLPAEGPADPITLGPHLVGGQRPQAVVAGGVWQACRVADNQAKDWGLLSCLVAPGFDFRDFHVATPDEVTRLTERFPDHRDEIALLAPGEA